MNTDYKVGDLVYDANIYDGLNTFITDLQFYKKWLPTNKDARILEFCCGTGRLTIPIAQEGYNICGVDYTLSMLEQAKAKAVENELAIDFIEADIRTLDLQEKFDLIFIPFNSIHHLYRNEEFHSTQNLDMRLFFPQELDSYLEWAGFNIIHKFGSFEEEVFNDSSEKQIYVLAPDK